MQRRYKAKIMTKDKERIRVYEKIRDELSKIQISNAENFDRSILTLSSAGLGISVFFIDNLIDVSDSQYVILLFLSWIFFVLTIVNTLLSFIVGQKGIKRQLDYAEKYYLEEDENYLLKKNKFQVFVDKYANWSIAFFIIAILFLMVFVITNIHKGDLKMSKEKSVQKELLTDSTAINILQKVDKGIMKKSAPLNNLQQVPKIPNDSGSNGSSSTQNTSSTSTNKDE